MDNRELSKKILELLGGKENVSNVTHCVTRLRVIVNDTKKIRSDEIGKLQGVLGINLVGTQYQVILGGRVVEIYNEFMDIVGKRTEKTSKKEKKNFINSIIDVFTGIFVPIIPAMIGAGLIKGILLFLLFGGLIQSDQSAYQFLMLFSDSIYYFLPILLACSTAEYFKCNKFVAMALAGILVHPDLITMLTGDSVIELLGFEVYKTSYSSTVVPAIFAVVFMCYVERFLKKVIPAILRTVLVPVLTILITAPVTLLILGPIGSVISNVIASNFLDFYMNYGVIAGALFSGLLPFMVLLGIHNGFSPVMVQSLATYGYEYLMGLNVSSNSAQAGATFAVFLKTKNKDFKSMAGSCAFSAIMGITEPALYGITTKLKKPLIGVCIGGALGGAIAGFFHVSATGMATGPLIGIPLFFTDTFIYFVISCLVAFVVSFMLTMLIGFDDIPETSEQFQEIETVKENMELKRALAAPVKGECKPVNQCKDTVFAEELLGKGVVMIPEDNKIYAPYDGKIVMLSDTLHAIGMQAANGMELLIHIGIDTVTLNGEGFVPHCKVGEDVKEGMLLMEFDGELLKEKGLSNEIPMIISNPDDYPNLHIVQKNVEVGEPIVTY